MPAPKSNRAPFQPRTFRVHNTDVRDRLLAAIQNMPVDADRPLEVVIREEAKKRKPDQSALMFAGPLRDISEQAWLDGKQFSVETWHEFCKRQFLPEQFDPEQCLETYQKWTVDPVGDRVLIGSTKNLTVRGMAAYIEQIHAFGAGLGVTFRTKGD